MAATAPNTNDVFLRKLIEFETELKTKFANLKTYIDKFMTEYLTYIEKLRERYLKSRIETFDKLQKLNTNRNSILSSTKVPDIDKTKQLSLISLEAETLKRNCIADISYEIDTSQIEINIPKSVTFQVKSSYVLRQNPDKSFGQIGKDKLDNFYLPRDLVIHPQTGRIYIADMGNNRILELTSEGQTICTFGQPHLKSPHGLAVLSEKIFVSDRYLNAIFLFNLNTYELEATTGQKGKLIGQFNEPRGIGIEQKNFIYVCDMMNDRVVVYDFELERKNTLRWNNIVKPVLIRFASPKMYLLCDSDPCLSVLDSTGTLLTILSNNYRATLEISGFFCLDSDENILICSHGGLILVYSKQGSLISKLGAQTVENASCHYGIAINAKGQIVTVSNQNNQCLQFY